MIHVQVFLPIFLLFFVMAEISCPSCHQIVKGEHGLSIHLSHWCPPKDTFHDEILQKHRDNVNMAALEAQRQSCLQAEQDAERVWIQQVQDALRAQHVAEFESMVVSLLSNVPPVLIGIYYTHYSMMVLI